MGEKFQDARHVIIENAMIVRSTLRASLILFLHGNSKYADEIKEALEPIVRSLREEEYDTEDVLHDAVQKALDQIISDKPIYVRAAIADLFDVMLTLAERKITFDEDKLLSKEEREAWVTILEGMIDACELYIKSNQ